MKYKIINIYGLTPEQLEQRLDDASKRGYSLIANSNLDFYLGKGDSGVFVFEKDGEGES